MLPIIDLQNFRHGDAETRRAIAETISEGCQSIGFIYVVNHGVPAETIDAARTAVQWFFALPDAEKRQIERPQGRLPWLHPAVSFFRGRAGASPGPL